VLKWVVHRVQNAVRSNFENHIGQRLRAEIAAGSYVEILTQIMAHRQLRFRSTATPGYAMVHAPDAERQPFAKVAENNSEFGILIKHPAAHQGRGVNRISARKPPGGAGEPQVPFVGLL